MNIKADNYQDYQNKIKEAAKGLYKSGKISSGHLEEILNSDLELPYIATEDYEYYSIDTAPGFCIDWMVKALKYDIENKPKSGGYTSHHWGFDISKETADNTMVWEFFVGKRKPFWEFFWDK